MNKFNITNHLINRINRNEIDEKLSKMKNQNININYKIYNKLMSITYEQIKNILLKQTSYKIIKIMENKITQTHNM
jgi:hypothetical protein